MVILTILQDSILPQHLVSSSWIPGVFGWIAAILLIDRIKPAQRWQIAAIAVFGAAIHFVAISRGADVDFGRIIGINTGLISMIAAVGFLRLVVSPGQADEKLPVGNRSYYRTMAGVWLFGSVINISAPIIFADRLAQRDGLGRLAAQSIVRVFTSCSGWSPFFGGMAVVLTYVPNVNLGLVMLLCLPFSLLGLAIVLAEGRIRFGEEVRRFRGYPVRFSSLWVPAVLAFVVMLLSWLAPSWSVLTHISIAALAVSIIGLKIWRSWSELIQELTRHVTNHVPGMINELSLFLVAGILATGLASFLASDIGLIPRSEFALSQAIVLLGVMVLLAVAGVHPVVTISGATPILLSFDPNPNLLAIVYLLAWSLGTCASPLSGTHLVFQGRYGISNWRAAVGNWNYVAVMYIAALPFLFCVNAIFTG